MKIRIIVYTGTATLDYAYIQVKAVTINERDLWLKNSKVVIKIYHAEAEYQVSIYSDDGYTCKERRYSYMTNVLKQERQEIQNTK